MPSGMGAEQNHSFDRDASGFEGGDVATDDGCNLASCLSHCMSSFVFVKYSWATFLVTSAARVAISSGYLVTTLIALSFATRSSWTVARIRCPNSSNRYKLCVRGGRAVEDSATIAFKSFSTAKWHMKIT
jgi:hypothetical protein